MKILDGKYTLRPFTPNDENGVLELWKIAFKSTMAKELFRWKYLENPYTQTMMLCVTDKDEVVTFYGGIPYLFQYEKKVVPVVNLMDIMSHPNHRENRIFEKTAKQFMSHFCLPSNLLLMYGFPGAFHYSIGERILNYRKVNQPLYLNLHLGYSNDKSIALSKIETSVEVLSSKEYKNSDKLFEQHSRWFDSLWEKCKRDYPFSIVRDSKFVNWRFISHPEKDYFILKIGATDEAFAVLQINGSKATIIDILMPNNFELFKGVISSIVEYLTAIDSHGEIKSIETWLPDNHFLATYAIDCGFQSQDEPVGIIPTVALFDHSPSIEWITSNLYYNMGDADLL
ncbi:MAG: GNAT family N-acetyltransferase [Desulfamplus sp.]|nr:GNAT family N-acetyltransferase [Desulfamplus sp.]